MGTIIVAVILIAAVAFALRPCIKHFKGSGGCCQGGDAPVKSGKKVLEGEIIAKKIITIDGMHCDNCRKSVEKSINEIDGALAKVNLEKREATVLMTREIEDKELKEAVRKAGFFAMKVDTEEI